MHGRSHVFCILDDADDDDNNDGDSIGGVAQMGMGMVLMPIMMMRRILIICKYHVERFHATP